MSTICIDNTSIGGKGFVNSQVVRSQIEDAQRASGVSLIRWELLSQHLMHVFSYL
mgnify:CR=1 FL=1